MTTLSIPTQGKQQMTPLLRFASVGNHAVKHTSHYVSWTTRVPYFYLSRLYVLAVMEMVLELDLVARSGEPQLRARGVISRSLHMVRPPRGSFIVYPLLSLEVVTTENK